MHWFYSQHLYGDYWRTLVPKSTLYASSDASRTDWRYRGWSPRWSRFYMTSIYNHLCWKAVKRSWTAILPIWRRSCIRIRRRDSPWVVSHRMYLLSDSQWRLFIVGKLQCLVCSLPLIETSQSLLLLFLCRHVVHARCASARGSIPSHTDINRASLTARIARLVSFLTRLTRIDTDMSSSH